MKIYDMDGCDWWVGESLESCQEGCIKAVGDGARVFGPFGGLINHAHELTDDELDHLVFIDFTDDPKVGVHRSFREQLDIEIRKGGPFPRLFASTEY